MGSRWIVRGWLHPMFSPSEVGRYRWRLVALLVAWWWRAWEWDAHSWVEPAPGGPR